MFKSLCAPKIRPCIPKEAILTARKWGFLSVCSSTLSWLMMEKPRSFFLCFSLDSQQFEKRRIVLFAVRDGACSTRDGTRFRDPTLELRCVQLGELIHGRTSRTLSAAPLNRRPLDGLEMCIALCAECLFEAEAAFIKVTSVGTSARKVR